MALSIPVKASSTVDVADCVWPDWLLARLATWLEGAQGVVFTHSHSGSLTGDRHLRPLQKSDPGVESHWLPASDG